MLPSRFCNRSQSFAIHIGWLSQLLRYALKKQRVRKMPVGVPVVPSERESGGEERVSAKLPERRLLDEFQD